ncbi:MAG TPA: hypothetical protein VKV80_10465 [Streptosporangiaceae bacterium]|nr:hypothetical protein [Streptosporangiaceae bacterium]
MVILVDQSRDGGFPADGSQAGYAPGGLCLDVRGPLVAGLVRPSAVVVPHVLADLQDEEVLLLVGFLWRIEADDDWATRTSRMLDLVMDGLAGPQTPSRAARK